MWLMKKVKNDTEKNNREKCGWTSLLDCPL